MRGIFLALCGLLGAALLIGCESAESSEEIADPAREVESAQAFVALGANIDVPAGAQDAAYYIVDDEIAEIRFTFNDAAYSYRASKLRDDISGVHEDGEDGREIELEAAGQQIEIETLEGGGRLAEWKFDPVSYSLSTEDDVSDEVIESLTRELMTETANAVSGTA